MADSSSSSSTPRPPPLPPPPMAPGSGGSAAPPPSAASGTGGTTPTLSSLPPPPTLVSRGANAGGGAASAKLPPPPALSSGLPPPPTFSKPSVPAAASPAAPASGGSNAALPDKSVHATTEHIPPLSSAPNTGNSLYDKADDEEGEGEDEALATRGQQRPTYFGSDAYQTAFSGNETFQMPPTGGEAGGEPVPPPHQQATDLQSPASGSSWTAWAGTIGATVTSHAPAAGTLLEKAGQLAFSTVESAGDLLVAPSGSMDGGIVAGGGGGNAADLLEGSSSHLAMGITASMAARGEGPATAAVNDGAAVKDNFANLFAGNKEALSSGPKESNGYGSADREEPDMAAMMATPDSSAHPLAPTPRSQQAIDEVAQDTMEEMAQQPKQTQQVGKKRRAASNPPPSTLASRQSRLPVLILPTADAQSIATKNNTTLPEMFRVFGNSRGFAAGGRDSTLEPMLPPFRSAGRSMALSWENIVLDFVSNADMEHRPVVEDEGEKGLGEAARLWDEDRADGDYGEEDDAEMDQLEGYVVDALAEDDEEERARREDGIPSMTSAAPSRRNSQMAEGDGADDTEHHHMPFSPRPEEALQACTDAAFGLTSLPAAPWLLRFRHVLDASTDGMAHEMLCNPSVVILAASTSEAGYVNCLAELANVHHLPRPYHDGRYDPNGLRREFLLLHDVVNGPKDFDENFALQQMRERFGFGCCAVLKVNSLVPRPVAISDGVNTAGEDAEWENADPSSPFVNNALAEGYTSHVEKGAKPPPIRGACLSPTDKRAIRRYVANMVATGLVPAIERRIANLNASVSNAKKGVKNVIKSFWRKPKENILVNVSGYEGSGAGGESNHNTVTSPSASGSGHSYRYDTIESQTRLLADTLFLMRDYDAALSAYRLVKDDYKHDKAHLHYASTQEMMVLCMHMLDPSGRDGRYAADVHHSIETALYSYTRASDEEKESEAGNAAVVRPNKAPYATRLATRLCLALSTTRSLCEGKHMEMADLLASASSHETPLGAAVLLEQSSAHYYRAGMPRKYAFHMLMAGHMFRSAGKLERHAFRCFAASLYVYHGERWGELRSHLRTALAAQLYGMGRYALSMQFYAKLIGMAGGGRVSVRSQQKFLNHIVNVCRDHRSEAIVAVDRMNECSNSSNAKGSASIEGLVDAVRHIEISNIGFPQVQDSSIRVHSTCAGNSSLSLGRSDSLPIASGDASETGDDLVWQDMTNCAEAELRSIIGGSSDISNERNSSHEDSGPSLPSAHSGDEMVDQVISEIDKEEREVEQRERQKRRGKIRTPEVRAISEPLTVSFSLKNPLGLDIELVDMQLVASLSCPKTGLVHTNEFSVSKKEEDNTAPGKKSWTFHGLEDEFQRPQFLCQVPIDSESDPSCATFDPDAGPYFVASKASLKMEANSSSVVSLKICPLAEGDLRVLGVRFHVMGDIWIQHRFNVKGPLLQDTNANRSKRARGESLLLRSTVRQEMPSLKVTITPDEHTHGTVLQGQTIRWTLKLSNLGYAAASNILLKTNAPWLNMTQSEEEDAESSAENRATSCCIGPSGTLMRVPLKSTNQPGTLQPGETIELPVAIRTSGGGRQDFYMLFRYELWKGNGNGNSLPTLPGLVPMHRWARELLSVPVYPSITMSATLMPSYSNKGEHILSVELMNYRSDRDTDLEIQMEKICIASRYFEIKQLQGQVKPDGSLLTPTAASLGGNESTAPPLKIGWQERVTLHYHVVPTERSDGSSVMFSNISFLSGNKMLLAESQPTTSHPYGAHVTDFMCRERAHEVFNSTLQSHRIEKERALAEQEKTGQPRHVAQIRRQKQESVISDGQSRASNSASQVKAAHPTSLASLCPLSGGSNINIICCWSALVGSEGDDDTIHGQHHLRNLLVRPQNKSKGCPLALTAKFNSRVSHNFDDGPLDEDIEITIRNRLIEAEVEFEFAVDHQSGFDFVGSTSFNSSLAGGDELSVPMRVRIHSVGVYNLQSVRLTVLNEGRKVPFLFPLQWTMLVLDA